MAATRDASVAVSLLTCVLLIVPPSVEVPAASLPSVPVAPAGSLVRTPGSRGCLRPRVTQCATSAAYSSGASSHTKWPASIVATGVCGWRAARKLGVGERDDPVAKPREDQYRRFDPPESLGEHR